MARMKMCHEAVVDFVAQEIRFDGVVFPYWVGPEPEVEIMDGIPLATLNIGVLSENVTVIGKSGHVTRPLVADHATEMAWARARATEIAHEGLADVIQWIGLGAPTAPDLTARIVELEQALVRSRDREQAALAEVGHLERLLLADTDEEADRG